jgi:hypothetical protein
MLECGAALQRNCSRSKPQSEVDKEPKQQQ